MTLPVLKRYARADYGQPAPRVRNVARTTPDRRGWGSGWPNCQPGKLVYVTVKRPRDGMAFTVRVREEMRDLVGYLMAASFALGAPVDWELRKKDEWSTRPNGTTVRQGGVGSYSCRAIKGSDQPSWHSWGLALDLNSRSNPMRRTAGFSSTQLPAVIEMWESAGFHWGGRWNASDAMHVEKLFRPEDTVTDLANARRAFERLRPTPPPPPPEEDMPFITTPLVGHEAVIGDPNASTTVRSRPSPKADAIIRSFPKGQTERWIVVGWVTGEHSVFGNSDQWLVRVAPDSGWEYTAKGNVREVTPSRLAQQVERMSQTQARALGHVNAAKATLEEG